MPQYMLVMIQPDGPPPGGLDGDFLKQVMADLDTIRDELTAAGSWVFAAGLHDASSATVVRAGEDGEILTTDGPYAEAKEHMGGVTVIDVADLDIALDYARRYTLATHLPIEVRPVRF
jgi:hypothetical protein